MEIVSINQFYNIIPVSEYGHAGEMCERNIQVAVRHNNAIPQELTNHSEPHGLGHYLVDGFAPEADDCFYPFMRRVDDIMDMYHLGAWPNNGLAYSPFIYPGARLNNGLAYSPLWRLSPDGDVLGCTVAMFDKKTGGVREILREHGWTKEHLFMKSTWDRRQLYVVSLAIEDNEFKAFFGGHLLKGNHKDVWVVQHELTALLGALAYPQYLWLAVGMEEELSPGLLGLLADSPSVLLWPDRTRAAQWKDLASGMGNCNVMETFAGGADMDDHLRQAVRKKYDKPPHDGAEPTF